jgi:hypothetical protein
VLGDSIVMSLCSYETVNLVKVYDPRYRDCVRFAVTFDYIKVTVPPEKIWRIPLGVFPSTFFVAPAQATVEVTFARGATLAGFPKDDIYCVQPAHGSTEMSFSIKTGGPIEVEGGYKWAQGEKIYHVRGKPKTEAFEWCFEAFPPGEGFLAGNMKLYIKLNNPTRPPKKAAELKVHAGPAYTVLNEDYTVPIGITWPWTRLAVLREMRDREVKPRSLEYILQP